MILALLACAALQAVAPADAWAPMAPDVDDPTAGDPPCVPGAWTVATPRGSTTVTVTCVGDGPPTWEADMLPERRTEATFGEDWTIYQGGTP